MLNDRSNIFLKRIKQKGAKLHYDENKLKEEVITKLQSINPKAAKPQGRSQTANSSTRSKSQQTLQGGVP